MWYSLFTFDVQGGPNFSVCEYNSSSSSANGVVNIQMKVLSCCSDNWDVSVTEVILSVCF